MKRFVAIDNVYALPRLVVLENGEVLAIVFDQPTPGLWAGGLACWHSPDFGATWNLRSSLTPKATDVTFMNVAVGMRPNGTLQAIYAGFGQRPPVGQPAPIDEATTLPTKSTVSLDGGMTWAPAVALPGPADGAHEFTPYGKIIAMADNRSATALYGYQTKSRSFAYFYEIVPGGHWQPAGIINQNGPSIDETELIAPGHGELLAFGRTNPDRRIVSFLSPDQGRSWKYLGPITGAGESPASICQTRDGKIILTYAFKQVNRQGIAARYSSDRGATWSPALQLAEYDSQTRGGHPSTVCLPNGHLLTAYYAESTPYHQRYHMAVVQWQVTDF